MSNADGAVDFTLGIPADTLALAGLTGLSPDAVLPIKVRGTQGRPTVDWVRSASSPSFLGLYLSDAFVVRIVNNPLSTSAKSVKEGWSKL